MLTAVRLGGYVGVLGVVFGAAWGGGALLQEDLAALPVPLAEHSVADAVREAAAERVTAPAPPEATVTDGLSASADGYTLTAATSTFTANRTADLTLRLTGPDGQPVAAYTGRPDGSELRLLVIRRDGVGLQILYPERNDDGAWTTPLRLAGAGAWRAIVEFTPGGAAPLTLGTDLSVPGDFRPTDPAPSRAAEVDGYQVRLDGDLRPGTESAIFATVSRGGRGVTDLEAQRGTFGEIVAMRAGDCAMVPVTAQTRAEPIDHSGPGIAFTTVVPTDGVYTLYLRFHHNGADHLATFTVPTFGLGTGPAGVSR
jgi:hypothetical protein